MAPLVGVVLQPRRQGAGEHRHGVVACRQPCDEPRAIRRRNHIHRVARAGADVHAGRRRHPHGHAADADLAIVLLAIAVRVVPDAVAENAGVAGVGRAIAEVRRQVVDPAGRLAGVVRRGRCPVVLVVLGHVARRHGGRVHAHPEAAGAQAVEEVGPVTIRDRRGHQGVAGARLVDAVAVVQVQVQLDVGDARLAAVLPTVAVGVHPDKVADGAGRHEAGVVGSIGVGGVGQGRVRAATHRLGGHRGAAVPVRVEGVGHRSGIGHGRREAGRRAEGQGEGRLSAQAIAVVVLVLQQVAEAVTAGEVGGGLQRGRRPAGVGDRPGSPRRPVYGLPAS